MVWDAINEYLTEKINVKINFHYILADEYTSKMQPMPMSGQKIVNVNGQLNYVEWAKKGAFVAMDDLLQYAPKTAELVGEHFFNAMRIDGKVYAIPSVKDSVQMYSARFNKTLNDELGPTIPAENNGYKDMVSYLYDAKAARDVKYPELAENGVPITRCYPDIEKWVQFEKINSLLGVNVAGIEGMTSYLHQAANAISSTSEHPVEAMKALELINTDEFVATALRFGLEGTHWILNEDGTLNANNDNNFYWYGAQFGANLYFVWEAHAMPENNLTYATPESLGIPTQAILDFLEDMKTFNIPLHR